jgi:hypothetical protein
MKKLIAETLNEFLEVSDNSKEDINEAMVGPRNLKKIFLSAGYAYVKAKNAKFLKGLLDWTIKLKKLEWPKDKVFKKENGMEDWKKFHMFLRAVEADLNPIAKGGRAGNTEKQLKYDLGHGKTDEEKAAVIAKAIKKDISYVKDLIR